MTTAATVTIRAWQSDGILLEQYAYTAGSAEPLPKHSHQEYQLGLNWDRHGEYNYQGTHQCIPPKRLCIIQSGEVHLPNQRTYISTPMTCWMMEIEPKVLQTIASERAERPSKFPVFPELVIPDSDLTYCFLHLHRIARATFSKLEQDSAVCQFLTRLIECHAKDVPSIRPLRLAHTAVQQVRDFLDAYYAENVSLEQLASIAGLSRFYLCRAFHKEIGVPPHVYKRQRQIAQAKRLLLQRVPPHQIALDIGFADQSHFGLHFKRLVGVTPGRYVQQSNNLLDNPD